MADKNVTRIKIINGFVAMKNLHLNDLMIGYFFISLLALFRSQHEKSQRDSNDKNLRDENKNVKKNTVGNQHTLTSLHTACSVVLFTG
jgi:hypothetical protein